MSPIRHAVARVSLAALAFASLPLHAQGNPPARVALTEAETLAAPGAEMLVFANWYDGLFADSKISGVEIVQQGVRTATNGDVRLSATPGQWDAIGSFKGRTVDKATGAITAQLAYPDHDFTYSIRAVPDGDAVKVSVVLDRPLPAALAGKAGFNLEFLPAAYFRKSFMADGRAQIFPLHPAATMVAGGDRARSSGRDIGPGAEPLPLATAKRFVLAPEDPARRVTVTSDSPVALFDGRNQAQNGWFVLRGMLPAGRTGTVLEWRIAAYSVPGWTRPPMVAHSQLGYLPDAAKIAVIERDPRAKSPATAQLVRIADDGLRTVALTGPARRWGKYLRYDYARFDFSAVKAPGLYAIRYAGQDGAPFRIAPDLYDDAWHATNDVYMPVAMDHLQVNEAYRIWHGDAHRDDARQAPVSYEHIDLYAQGPTTDTKFAPGEHIPGLNVGGWLDAGDFDIRTQTNYSVVRQLVSAWEQFRPDRDTLLVDQKLRRAELHVPDGKPDVLQQVQHGTLQLLAQFDAVGHAIHGIVEPDVAQYTHLGDAASKTDGLPFDPALKFGEERDGRSGTPDDRWAFTTKASALNYGSAAALAAAARVLGDVDPALAAKARRQAEAVWADEWARAPDLYAHGNTTGGPLDLEQFRAAVELLALTRDAKYAAAVEQLWPAFAEKYFAFEARTAVQSLPFMPAAFRAKVEARTRQAWPDMAKMADANPFGVPITTGGWAGSGAVLAYGLNAYALHGAFPDIVGREPVLRALEYLHGNHPGSNVSLVSGVGTVSKEVAYGSNRADFSFIAGGVVPGVLVLKPDLPENKEDWPFLWGENEYVIDEGATYITLVNAARSFVTHP